MIDADLKVFDLADGDLHNPREPFCTLVHEKPEHRIVCFMKAQGFSNREIAEKTGYTPEHIGTIVRQPWARKRILEEIHIGGKDEVVALFASAKAEIAERMIAIATGEVECPVAIQKSAGEYVIDRLYGKATQPIKQDFSDGDLAKMTDEELLRLAKGN